LDTASGRYPCDAQGCDQSSCAAIKDNYDSSTRTFKAPPAIRRADGTDALRQREAKVYTGAFQISGQDQEKLEQGAAAQGGDGQQSDGVTQSGESKKSRRTRPRGQTTTPTDQAGGEGQQDQSGHPYHPGKINDFTFYFQKRFVESFKL
jgi:hypothetical protein